MLLRLLLCLLLLPSVVQAATFWEETFETTGAGNRFGLLDNSGPVQLSTTQKYAGSKSAYIYFDFPSAGSCLPGNPAFIDCGGYYDATFTPTSTLWRRFWIWVSPTFTVATPSTKITKAGGTGFSEWLVIGYNQTTSDTKWQLTMDPQTTPADTFWGGVLPHDGTFHCVEIEQQLNTPGVANGVYTLYLDGSSTASAHRTNAIWRMANDTSLFSYVRLFRQYGSGQMYFDNYAVGDTRIGCGAAPPPGDTTPPSAPTSPAVSVSGVSETITFTIGSDNTGGSGLAGTVVLNCTGASCTPTNTVTTISSPTASYTATGLTAGTIYGWALRSQDIAGNLSAATTPVYGTTASGSVYRTVLATYGCPAPDNSSTLNGALWDGGYLQVGAVVADNFKIVSDRCLGKSTSNDSFMTYNGITTPNDQYMSMDLSVYDPATGYPGVGVRYANSTTMSGYTCRVVAPGTTTAIYKLTAGTQSTLVSGTTSVWAQGDTMRCEAQGTALRFYRVRAGVETLMQSTTDASYASGKVALSSYANPLTAGQYDNIIIGGFDSTPPTPPAIVTLTTSSTGFTETDTGTPTSYKLTYGSNSNPNPTVLIIGASSIVAGAYTITWPQDTQFACLYAIDSAGTVNTTSPQPICNTVTPGSVDHGPATGVLRKLGSTPWLTDDSGNARFMVGNSNCFNCMEDWTNVANIARGTVFDADVKFAALQAIGMKFVRFYHSEQTQGSVAEFAANTYALHPYDQMPWKLVSTRSDSTSGTAITVGVYDLDQWNPAFFARARTNALKALSYGLTPSIMLFNGGTVKYNENIAWANPLYSSNNVNGVNCEQVVDGECIELQTTTYPALLARQKAYIEKSIDNLNDIDGIVWEISSEDYSATASQTWQDWVYDTIHNYEALNGRKVHPIWRTAAGWSVKAADNSYLFSNAKSQIVGPGGKTIFISGSEDYELDPPVNDGSKVVFSDTDHQGTEVSGWPWKVFTRGHYPVFVSERESAGTQTLIETQMARVQHYADVMHLAGMLPVANTTIIATGYGLKEDCSEYLMFQPSAATNAIDLSSCTGKTFDVEYNDPATDTTTSGGTVAGGASRNFTASAMRVVYLKLTPTPADTTAPTIFGCTIAGQTTGGILPIGTTSATLQCFSNESATLKYGTTASVAYASQPNTMTAGTFDGVQQAHTATISGLTNGLSVTDYVRGIDASGNASSSDTSIAWSVAGQADMTAPVLSNPIPLNSYPSGSGGGPIGFTVDEMSTCKYDTVDTTYALMANTMTSAFPTCSATVTGRSNNTTTLYYGRACDLAEPTPNCDTTSIIMSVSIAAAAGDVTAPGTVSGLAATVTGLQVELIWTAATGGDVAGYYVYQCAVSDCSDAVLKQTLGNTTTTFLGLNYSSTYYWAVKAFDTSNNPSAALSNIATGTTRGPADTVNPSTMTNLRLIQAYTGSALFTSDNGTDDSGAVTTTLELSPAGCAAYVFVYSNLALEALVTNLAPSTTYCVRGNFSDGTNLSSTYSNVVTFTTAASGLDRPRRALPFGVTRNSLSAPRNPRN